MVNMTNRPGAMELCESIHITLYIYLSRGFRSCKYDIQSQQYAATQGETRQPKTPSGRTRF